MFIFSESNSRQLFNTGQIVLICIAAFCSFIFACFLKKGWYRFVLRKKYYIFPKISTRGITNIAMVISISVCVILMLTFLTAGILAVLFRVYPGSRITIEGILIKIGGLLFGPIIGIFIGAATDLLTIALSAGSFHYGYFIVTILYGFFGGIIRVIWDVCQNRNIVFSSVISILWAFMLTCIFFYLSSLGFNHFQINLFGRDFDISKKIIISICAGLFGFAFLFLWGFCLFFNKTKIKMFFEERKINALYRKPIKDFNNKYLNDRQLFYQEHLKFISNNLSNIKLRKPSVLDVKTTTQFDYIGPIIAVVFIGECLIEILILPNIDVQLSAYNFEYWTIIRTLDLLIMIPFNLVVLYPIYKILLKNIDYNYLNDSVKSL